MQSEAGKYAWSSMERSKEAQTLKAQLDKFIDAETEANKALQKRKQELENRRIRFKFEIAAAFNISSKGKTGAKGFQKQLSSLAEIQRRNKELLSDIQRLQEEEEIEVSQGDITVSERKPPLLKQINVKLLKIQSTLTFSLTFTDKSS